MPLDHPAFRPLPEHSAPRMVIAMPMSGDGPAWRLDQVEDTLLLVVAGRPTIRTKSMRRRHSPRGTVIEAATDKGAPLTVTVEFGACDLGPPRGTTSHIAHVTLGGERWHGCFLGPRADGKPLID